jgi:hypothetical protein
LAPLSRFLNLEDVLAGAEKALKGLATKFHFFKVRIGKRNGARMIVFLVTEGQKAVPVLIRLKRDKVFGMNMAMNNEKVVDQLKKNMSRILEDIEAKEYEEFPLKRA